MPAMPTLAKAGGKRPGVLAVSLVANVCVAHRRRLHPSSSRANRADAITPPNSMPDYPKLPPRLARIFTNNPLFFVTFCTHRRRKVLARNSVNDGLGGILNPSADGTSHRGRLLCDHAGSFAPFVCGPDDLLRSAESYGQKWNYVRENPIRAGLVKKAEDWPYAGEIIIIDRA